MAAIDASAHVGLDVGGHLERLGDRFVRALGGVERAMLAPPAQPFTWRPGATGKSGASGDLVLDLGGPSSGRFWQVLGCVVGGRLWSSTVAGKALIVVSSTRPTDAAGTPLGFVVDEYDALPKVVAGYGRGVIELESPEHLFVVIATPTASTEYNAGATVAQYETAARVQTAAS